MANIVASFYKYAAINDPLKLRNGQLELCQSLNLKGRILIGKEGINGSVCGKRENVQKYRQELKKTLYFPIWNSRSRNPKSRPSADCTFQ